MGLQILFRRLWQGSCQGAAVELGPGKAAPLTDIADQRVGEDLRGSDAARNRGLQDVAGDIHADVFLEPGRGQAGPVECEFIGLAVKFAVEPLKRGRRQNLPLHFGIANGNAKPFGLILQRGGSDQPLQDCAIDAEGLCLGQVDALAGLGLQAAQFLL